MVSKRQKLARKRFREANPNLFPPVVPNSTSSDPSSSKKRNKIKKGAAPKKNGIGKKRKLGGKKHPLRIPGMRPGEGCFICRSTDHSAKLCPEKAIWDKNKICLLCRRRGHTLKNCKEKNEKSENKFCYNCGEVGHSLSKCSKPLEQGGTKFAECFICHEQGHLSKNCQKNTHGVYPKGGCCRICGEVTHLAKHCPKKRKQDSSTYSSDQNISVKETEGDPYEPQTIGGGGDDLDDDFVEEETSNVKSKTSESVATKGVAAQRTQTKSKTKHGVKVVNFFG